MLTTVESFFPCSPLQKPGIVTGDSFVGWLFGLPPSDATMHDTGYSTHSTTSQAGIPPTQGTQPASGRKESISPNEKTLPSVQPLAMPSLPSYPIPSHQHHIRQQTGMAL